MLPYFARFGIHMERIHVHHVPPFVRWYSVPMQIVSIWQGNVWPWATFHM